MAVGIKGKNRIKLESAGHKAVVGLDWNGETKNWLLAAYKKKNHPLPKGGLASLVI
ncbi:MAG: hypothetical protein HUU08_13865 [Candidatus Brocadia sp.]|nr:hypothetical protein [Candidatus Brocadia sp.]